MTFAQQMTLLAAGYFMGAVSVTFAFFLGRASAHTRTDREQVIEDAEQARNVGTAKHRPLRGYPGPPAVDLPTDAQVPRPLGRPPIHNDGGTTTTKGSGDFMAKDRKRWRGHYLCHRCLDATGLHRDLLTDYHVDLDRCDRCRMPATLYRAHEPPSPRPPWSGRGPSPLARDKRRGPLPPRE